MFTVFISYHLQIVFKFSNLQFEEKIFNFFVSYEAFEQTSTSTGIMFLDFLIPKFSIFSRLINFSYLVKKTNFLRKRKKTANFFLTLLQLIWQLSSYKKVESHLWQFLPLVKNKQRKLCATIHRK